jgi:hypothetical protein
LSTKARRSRFARKILAAAVPKKSRKALRRLFSLPRRTKQPAAKGGDVINEIFESDHDRGRFGQCFELGRVRSKERDNVKYDGSVDARILEVIAESCE